MNGFKIGFFGVCTAETINLSFPGETYFAPVIETAQKLVDELKDRGADAIIAVTHQHMHDDEVLARSKFILSYLFFTSK